MPGRIVRRIFSLPIRAQMLLMALIVALPAAGIIMHLGLKLRQQVISEAIAETRKICDSMANEQLQAAHSAEVLMVALAQLPEITSRDADKTQQMLSDIVSLNPMFLNISVIEPSGKVWASAVTTRPAYVGDRRYFRNAMATGRISSGEYVVSRMANRPTINICYPFRDAGGAIAGALTVGLRLDRLGHNVYQAHSPNYSYTISDRSGVILAGSPAAGKVMGGRELPAIWKEMNSNAGDTTFVGRGFGGQERYLTFRKIYLKGEKEPYMFIRTGVPVAQVLEQADRLLIQNLVIFASSLVCAFLAAWFVGKRFIVDRVTALQAASRRLAEGDLNYRVLDSIKGGELGELGNAFDEMARRLEEREQQRNRAEEELRQLHAHLEQRVKERTAELEAAIREQESFSYSVSHDLRSPLRHINSYLAILREEFTDCFPHEALYFMERAEAASLKMGQLIDDLLELSRVSRSALVKEPVDLSLLATGILARLKETDPERSAEVVIAPQLKAMGDKVLMELVLENLLGNAWKYTSRNRHARIVFGSTESAGETSFFVKDNGAGFDMAYQDKLFGAFQRLHGEEYDGTGIGLATVKRVLERHGGRVWAEGELGAGATFYFSLP